MFKLPLCDLVTTHPRLVSWRALCTSLDALARHRVSRRANPFHILQGFSISDISAVSIGFLVNIGMCAILVVVQWYRYRRVSSPLERQQTKWVVFGFAVFITWDVIGIVPYLLFPGVASPDSLYLPVYSAVQAIVIFFIPLSFGFAMLRSRLWEIDTIINRTLVYGALTVS